MAPQWAKAVGVSPATFAHLRFRSGAQYPDTGELAPRAVSASFSTMPVARVSSQAMVTGCLRTCHMPDTVEEQ